jgi:glycosyltransferase involved in cell wall biosynthesis
MRLLMRLLIFFVRGLVEFLALPVLVLVAGLSRFFDRAIDVGLGPEPLINNVYHKRALMKYGYSAETFVTSLYFITDDFDRRLIFNSRFVRLFLPFAVFLLSVVRYKCVYFYFNGGPLFHTASLWRIEPFLFRLAGVRTVVMPYGGDVQCLDRCPNLLFRHAMAMDYPAHRFRLSAIRNRIDLWSRYADHVIAGCDWVDYLYYWNTLMLAHFSIDTEVWREVSADVESRTPNADSPLRVLHAPNHRELKGTRYFVQAVQELSREGVPIELVMAEKLPNDQIRELIKSVDVVADQLVIGWYAMFAIEAMSLGKPVLCYLRDDLMRFYVDAALIGADEIPVINCSPSTVKEALRSLVARHHELRTIGRRGRAFVEKHHSLEAVGKTFDSINRSLGVMPSRSY